MHNRVSTQRLIKNLREMLSEVLCKLQLKLSYKLLKLFQRLLFQPFISPMRAMLIHGILHRVLTNLKVKRFQMHKMRLRLHSELRRPHMPQMPGRMCHVQARLLSIMFSRMRAPELRKFSRHLSTLSAKLLRMPR